MKSIHKGFYQTTFGICLLEHDILYQVGKLPCFFLDHLLILSFDHDSYQRLGSGRTDQDTALSGEFFLDRKSTRLNSSHANESRMPSSA